MAGYTRQSTFSDGDVIQAADSSDEFNQLLAAFVNTTGHKHDGTAAEGPVIGLIGDPGVASPLNKVVVDDTNNQIEFSVDVSSSSTEQFVVKDGVIEPTTDDDIDLGSTSKKFKDLFIDGTANIDVLNLNGTALTVTGAELNIMDGGTSVGTTAVAGSDGIVTNDAGTMQHTSVDTFDTYLSATTKTLTNKTLTSAVLNGTISGTSIKDEDDLSSDSASHLATQQSIKAYVDAQITAEDLDFQADSGGALNIDLDSETLTFTGGTGIDTSGSGNAVTFAIDSTVTTLAGSQTLTNKTLTTPIINAGAQLKNGATSAGFLEFFEDSDNGTNKATLIGPASTADVTLTLPAATDTLIGKATTDTLTNKTLTSAVLNGTISGTSIKDEDNMASDSASHLATQQSIKAYVDSQVSGVTASSTTTFTNKSLTAPILTGSASAAGSILFKEDTDNGTNAVTLIGPASTADVTVTLPATAGTVALTSDVPSAGISSGNVATFTTGAVDNDFLRIDGTAIEGRSASEVLSDIGAQASLTFGISNTNAVKIDGSSVADDEYARFTANGLESRSTSEVLSDIGAITASSSDTLTNKSIVATQLTGTVANARLDAQLQDVAGLAVTDSGFIVGDGSNFVLETGATVRTSLGLGTAAVANTGTSASNVVVLDGSARLPAVDGSQLTNLPSSGSGISQADADAGATALAIALG
tara:strand:- start:816 stop:2915 length:2100 start_codon:yes stop_codon:yes gene_type:complete